MVKYIQQGGYTGKTMVAITSGANMDFDRYAISLYTVLYSWYYGTAHYLLCYSTHFLLYLLLCFVACVDCVYSVPMVLHTDELCCSECAID